MAKELPYFKFEPSEWLEGEIQIISDTAIVCFINLCSGYWLKLGCISYAFALHKYCRKDRSVLQELISNNIIQVIDDEIRISFLDNQFEEFKGISEKRSNAANKRWKNNTDNQKVNASALQKESKSNAIREEKRKEDKRKEEKIRENTNNILLSEIKISDLENEEVEYFEIANAFKDLFIKNLTEKNAPTKNQTNAKYKNYVDPIRLMMTNDGVTKEQITKVFKFLDSPVGEFWKPNILSTKKLREKFEQLIIKSQSPNGTKQPDQRTNQQIAEDAFNSDTAKQFRFR